MLVVIVVILILILGMMWWIAQQLNDLLEYTLETQRQTSRLVELSLNPRTRIGTIAPRSGVETKEKQLSKLGRASSARRVVVGGDPNSQLNSDLNQGTQEDEDG